MTQAVRLLDYDIIEEHDVPETRSDERQHWLDPQCWCRPAVHTRRDEHGQATARLVQHDLGEPQVPA